MSIICLFDRIHNTIQERLMPVTMDEFLEFGLEAIDFIHYVALQQKLQCEIITTEYLTRDIISIVKNEKNDRVEKAASELLEFCVAKGLVSEWLVKREFIFGLSQFDAAYIHKEIVLPMDVDEFRLGIERKLSEEYDEKEDYLFENFGSISFVYDCELDENWKGGFVPIEEPLRVKRYDFEKKEYVILSRDEVKELKMISDKEIQQFESELCTHCMNEPQEYDSRLREEIKSWIKEYYRISNKIDYAEEIHEEIAEALSTPDLRIIKSTDVLNVLSKKSPAEIYGYEIIATKAEFSFYSGRVELLPIKWCSYYDEYQISWEDFDILVSKYGFPKMRIKYDGEIFNDSASDFNETSIFYDLGYTVSESVGLSSERRQAILLNAINSGKASWHETTRYLNQMLNINAKKPGNEQAAKKWKEDYDFISMKFRKIK